MTTSINHDAMQQRYYINTLHSIRCYLPFYRCCWWFLPIKTSKSLSAIYTLLNKLLTRKRRLCSFVVGLFCLSSFSFKSHATKLHVWTIYTCVFNTFTFYTAYLCFVKPKSHIFFPITNYFTAILYFAKIFARLKQNLWRPILSDNCQMLAKHRISFYKTAHLNHFSILHHETKWIMVIPW